MSAQGPNNDAHVTSTAPVIKADPDSGHSGLVVSCPAHALPFGVVFDEYAARRGDDLEGCASEVFTVDQASALSKLKEKLKERDDKYLELACCKKHPETLPSEIDRLERECSDLDRPFKRLLHRMNGNAVCLSGGGIRSASFSLGVLEGLARLSLGLLSPARRANSSGFLHELDYLSTVSGGGYIGCWLTAWVYRRRTAAIQRAQAEVDAKTDKLNKIRAQIDGATGKTGRSPLARTTTWIKNLTAAFAPKSSGQVGLLDQLVNAKTEADAANERLKKAKAETWKPSYGEVVNALAGESDCTSGDPEPQPVRHLRDYTSYLAPAMGLSLDSWDLVAIVFRNLLVNWVMLAPLLLAVVAIPQVSYHITLDFRSHWVRSASLLSLALVFILFLIAAVFSGRSLPSHRSGMGAGPNSGRVALGFAGPVLLANWILAQLWEGNQWIDWTDWGWPKFLVFIISYAGFFTLASLLFRTYRKRILQSSRPELVRGGRGWLRFLVMQIAAIVSALVTTELLGLLAGRVLPKLLTTPLWKLGSPDDEKLYTVLAFPLITLVPLVSHSLFGGLLGIFEQEEDREWLSRAGGIQLAAIAGWVLAHAITLYATDALTAIRLAVGGAVLGGIGSALGWSEASSAGPRPVKAAQLGKLGSFLKKHDLLLPTLCAAALLLLTLGAAGAEFALAGGEKATLTSHLAILVVTVVLGFLLNWAINVNLFSLHGMYRMRLMRAFLGASNTQRYPDSFTGFDPKDTPLEKDLPKGVGAPLHLINTTLNLVGSKNLAWRQRKAASFTFSPLHSGAWRLAYVPTEEYAGADGVSLATAMAISGAAFNPNMGYHSSPLVTLLMTFFNVRLGWWLPNPAREEGARWPWAAKGSYFLHKTGPTVALQPLILEALGMTDESYRWIELTDGGHFENLALYEMVLRRCHNIVVVDAGADPECQFEDLGNALRKIEIDLGIPIRFNDGLKMNKGSRGDNRYCAVAMIDYGCVDDHGSLPEPERSNLAGTLIYIKASLTGAEPPDIKQYALSHPTFPHETTANQFFNESQFESYRHLGSFAVETIVKEGTRPPLQRSWGQSPPTGSPADTPLSIDFKSLTTAARTYTGQASPPSSPLVSSAE